MDKNLNHNNIDENMKDLSKLDSETAFKVKIQIALAWNAQRVMDIYPEKKGRFIEYIEERKNAIREILHIEHDEILENGKKIFEV